MDTVYGRGEKISSYSSQVEDLCERLPKTLKMFEAGRQFNRKEDLTVFLEDCDRLLLEAEQCKSEGAVQVSKLVQGFADARLSVFLTGFQSKMLGGYFKAAPHKYSTLHRMVHTTENMIVQFIRDLINRSSCPLASLHALGYSESRLYERGMHVSVRFSKPGTTPLNSKCGDSDQQGLVVPAKSRKNSSEDSGPDTEASSVGNSSRNSGLSKKNVGRDPDFALHSSPIKVESNKAGSSGQKSPRKQQHDLELTENDQDFTNELKEHIKGNNHIPDEYRKYFKSFFCDFTLSNSLRRWLWQERIGNPIRMNRFVFNNLLVRSKVESMSVNTDDIVVEDLLRCCRDVEDPFLAEIMFANVKKIAHLLEVRS